MTCIAIIKGKNNKLLMAGDRRVTGYNHHHSMTGPKITAVNNGIRNNKKGEVLLGGCGDGFICSLVVDRMTIPRIEYGEYAQDWIYEKFVKNVDSVLKRYGYMDKVSKELKLPKKTSCGVLVGVLGEIFEIDIFNDHGVSLINVNDKIGSPYAVGSGEDPARFSGEAYLDEDVYVYDDKKDKYRKLTDREILYRMLDKAAKFNPYVDNKIDIIQEI